MNRYTRNYRDDYDYYYDQDEFYDDYRSIQVNVSLRDHDVFNNNRRGIKRTRISAGISSSDLRRYKRSRDDNFEYEDNHSRYHKEKERETEEKE